MPSMEMLVGSLTSRGPRSDLMELAGIVLGGDLHMQPAPDFLKLHCRPWLQGPEIQHHIKYGPQRSCGDAKLHMYATSNQHVSLIRKLNPVLHMSTMRA